MKGLRYDLVLSLVVIASHYIDVLVDLLNVQLRQPSTTPNVSLSMMAAHDATKITEASQIHPQALSNWRSDEYRQQLYVFEPLFFAMGNTVLQDYTTLGLIPLPTSDIRLIPRLAFSSNLTSNRFFLILKLLPYYGLSRKNVTIRIYPSSPTMKL